MSLYFLLCLNSGDRKFLEYQELHRERSKFMVVLIAYLEGEKNYLIVFILFPWFFVQLYFLKFPK